MKKIRTTLSINFIPIVITISFFLMASAAFSTQLSQPEAATVLVNLLMMSCIMFTLVKSIDNIFTRIFPLLLGTMLLWLSVIGLAYEMPYATPLTAFSLAASRIIFIIAVKKEKKFEAEYMS